jgi:threonine dehydratase
MQAVPDREGGGEGAHDFAELSARVDLDAAQRAIARGAVTTPTLASADLSELAGGPVVLKAESLQVSG